MSKRKPSPKTKALDLAAIVKRLTSGETTLFQESTKAGLIPNTPLRNALREYLGGKPQYAKMIAKAMKARATQEEKKPARKAA